VYVLFVLAGDLSLVSDLSRQLRINDQVLRFLAVKKDKFAPDLQHRSGRDRLDDDAFAGIGVGDLDASDEVSL
jgi:ribosomal protein S6